MYKRNVRHNYTLWNICVTSIVGATVLVSGSYAHGSEAKNINKQTNYPIAGVTYYLYENTVPLSEDDVTIKFSDAELVGSSLDSEISEEEKIEYTYDIGDTLYVTANINLRQDKNAESASIGAICTGEKVTVADKSEADWICVNYKDTVGYVCGDYVSNEAPLIKVSATAYWNEYNRGSASGRQLVQGKSIAGMVGWLHRSVNIYRCNSDGTVGEFVGTFVFDDTGYGAETGYGESKILPGKTVGTIENGTCIDMYYDNLSGCKTWGRQDVFIQFVD